MSGQLAILLSVYTGRKRQTGLPVTRLICRGRNVLSRLMWLFFRVYEIRFNCIGVTMCDLDHDVESIFLHMYLNIFS